MQVLYGLPFYSRRSQKRSLSEEDLHTVAHVKKKCISPYTLQSESPILRHSQAQAQGTQPAKQNNFSSNNNRPHVVLIEDIDEYLGPQDDSPDASTVMNIINESKEDGTVLLNANVNGSCVPMEKLEGETRLRIPAFVLKSPKGDSTPSSRALIIYQPPLKEQFSSRLEEPEEHQEDTSDSIMDIDDTVNCQWSDQLKTQPLWSNNVDSSIAAMEID